MLNRRHMLQASAGSLVALGLSGTIGFSQRMPSIAAVLYDVDIPVLGNGNGDVTIVEYFDYQCPYCKAHHDELLDVVGNDGNIRLIMKDWTISGDVSVYAARLVLAAEKLGKYEEALNALMATAGRLTKDQVKAVLQKKSLDTTELEATYQAHSSWVYAILQRNAEQCDAMNFRGTPSFVIGTKLYGGVMRRRQLIDAIEAARRA